MTPFPVLHGEDYVSHGFLFGPTGNKICYISDVSRVPPESMEFLQEQGPIQLLVCDALTRSRKHPTHFRQALVCAVEGSRLGVVEGHCRRIGQRWRQRARNVRL